MLRVSAPSRKFPDGTKTWALSYRRKSHGKFKKQKITTRVVNALKPGETVADTLFPGYHVRCQKAAKIYFVRKYAHGRQHYVSIGEHGTMGLTEKKARDQALIILGAIRDGLDPTAERANGSDEKSKGLFQAHNKKSKETHASPHTSNKRTTEEILFDELERAKFWIKALRDVGAETQEQRLGFDKMIDSMQAVLDQSKGSINA